MATPHGHHYRWHLQHVVAASTAPYGYTLTLWTSGAVATHARGVPSTIDALLLLCGAVLAFGLVGAGAFGSVNRVIPPDPEQNLRMWAGFHLPSVGLSVVACSAIAHVASVHYVWPLVGFTATALYLLVLAAQFWVAARRYQSFRSAN